jgi:hypothetical protein
MLDLSSIISEIIVFLQANIKITIALALVMLYLLLKKTRLFFFLLFLSLIVVSLFYLISNIASTGTSYKTKMINQSTTK